MASNSFHCVALDFIGHGHSDHLPVSGIYDTVKSTYHINSMVKALEWTTNDLVCHSMGTQLGIAYAGTFPEKVNKIVCIEGFGPLVQPAESTAKILRKAITDTDTFLQKTSSPKVYNFSEAVSARMNSVSTYPGNQYLSREASFDLVSRGTFRVDDPDNIEDISDDNVNVRFRHDPRLVLPSFQFHTNEQALSFFENINSRVLEVTAEHGWPLSRSDLKRRRDYLSEKGLLTQAKLPGSHHLHMDPDSRDLTAQTVVEFLLKDRQT